MTDEIATKEPLTDMQAKVLAFMRDNAAMFGPSFREMMRHFGWRSPHAVTNHVRELERKGYIARRHGVARGIEVLP